ncbi:type II secretion system protein M [Patescibacteria group bacterium]|nr:type II secretion system protein M [Patescibacteria group bacterium]
MEKKGMKLYEKKQLPMLVGVVGALAATLLVVYWISPMWDSVKASILDYEKVSSQLEAKDSELDALQKFKIYLSKEGDKVELMNNVLPTAEDLDDVLIQIERMAINNTLFVKNMNIAEETREEPSEFPEMNRVKVTMQIDGEFPSIMNFLTDLERSTRLFLISKLNIASNLVSTDQPVAYTVEMEVMYLK